MKTCSNCGITKELSKFHKAKLGKYGVRGDCKECIAIAYMKDPLKEEKAKLQIQRRYDDRENIRLKAKEKYINNKEEHKAYQHNYRVFTKYGLTTKIYEVLKESQGNCAICGRSWAELGFKNIHLDHNHTDGDIREFLCSSCNQALGLLKENPKIIQSMLNYIELWNTKE